MTRVSKQFLAIAIALASTATLAAQDGQQPAAPSPRPAPGAPTPMKVSLVFSRYQGDKKISSVPHVLWVTANDGNRPTSLRLGTQIPVTSTVFAKDGEKTQSYNYRDVGTNIDVTANTSPIEGAFRLSITINDSSVYYPDQSDPAARSMSAATGAPAFRNFNSTFVLLIRDGQTVQSTSVTDPVSGQVIKLDATVNVQK